MPRYAVKDTDGTTLTIQGDSPPTEQELTQIFSEAKSKAYPPRELTPYEQYQKAPSDANRESYSESVPKSLNPDYDFTRATGGNPAGKLISGAVDLVGQGLVKIADIPTRISNRGKTPESLGYVPTLEERTADGKNIISLPRSTGTDPVSGALNVVSGLAESVVGRPQSAFMIPLTLGEGEIAKLAATGFGAQMAAGLPEAVQNAAQVLNDPNATDAQKTEAIGNPIVQAYFAKTILQHGMAEPGAKPIQGPMATGEVLKTPKGAVPSLTPLTDEALKQTTVVPIDITSSIPKELRINKEAAPVTAQPPTESSLSPTTASIETTAPATTEAAVMLESNVTPDVTQIESKPVETPTAEATAPATEKTPPADSATENAATVKSEATTVISSDGGDTYGIAERVRQERAAKGQTDEIPTGEGISAPDSVEHGRELLTSGADPEASMKDFESTKKMSSDDMAVARAYGEQLNKTARDLEKSKGVDSPEYQAAKTALNEWDKRSKAMQTEWHKTGQAQQGETDVDTGSFTGLQRAHADATGKDFTEPQANKAKAISEKVSTAETEAESATAKLNEHLSEKASEVAPKAEPAIHPRVLEIANKIIANLDKRADAARARIKARAGSTFAGVDPTVLRDVAEIGASHLAHIGKDFALWSAKMIEEFGEKIKPHLDDLYKRSNDLMDGINTSERVRKVVTSPSERNKYSVVSDAISKAYGKDADVSKGVAKDLKENPIDSEKQRVADAAEKQLKSERDAFETAKVQEEAAKKAKAVADKTVRESAAEMAKEETNRRVEEIKRDKETAAIQDKAKRAAQRVTDKAARDAASKLAKEKSKKTVEAAKRARDAAIIQEKVAKKAIQIAQNRVRDAAIKAAEAERNNQVNPEIRIWNKVREYLSNGETSFDDIRSKVATDLGIPISKVTDIMTRDQRAKYLANEAWKKQQDLRRLKSAAKRWLREQQIPKWQNYISRVPRTMFALKVGFHGTVALGTHAPMVAFQPPFWKTYIQNFGKMYRMVGTLTKEGQSRGSAYYEMQVQDLMRNKNYITARRAGLQNDPYSYEDFNSPDMSEYIGNITGMGNRGYAVLKLLRQDMFDEQWNKLPKTSQISEVAEALADGINHSTGVTKKSFGGASVALFAPRLEGSRVAWLAVDPAKAATTFFNWKNAPLGEKTFAINQVKEKAWVFGTFVSLLAINQGVLSATGSKQKINGIPESLGGAGFDPTRSDFLKFKAAGMNVSYGNAMISMARMPARLFVDIENDGKMNKIKYPDDNVSKTLFGYARSQASPFTGTMTDLALGYDFEERPLPRKAFGLLPGSNTMPKRLKAEGKAPYTWPEYISQTASPIPFVEPVREVWKVGLGMSEEQIKTYWKAFAVSAFDAGTGGRVTTDYDVK